MPCTLVVATSLVDLVMRVRVSAKTWAEPSPSRYLTRVVLVVNGRRSIYPWTRSWLRVVGKISWCSVGSTKTT
jgi:hypothetical protein